MPEPEARELMTIAGEIRGNCAHREAAEVAALPGGRFTPEQLNRAATAVYIALPVDVATQVASMLRQAAQDATKVDQLTIALRSALTHVPGPFQATEWQRLVE
jgi:hypothetical protein